MDFTEVLNSKPADIEKPPLPPKGEYTYKVTKPGTMRDAGEKYTVISFSCQAIAAHESVDADMLNESGGLASAHNKVDFMFTKNPENDEEGLNNQRTAERLKRFLFEHLGMEDEGQSMKAAIEAAANYQFIGTMDYRKDKNDPENMFAQITKTAPAA